MKKYYSFLALIFGFSIFTINHNNKVTVNAKDYSLLYELDFEDNTNFGKNTSESTFADAQVFNKNITQVQRDETSKGIMLSGDSSFENYLSLPTEMLEDCTNFTLAGWFYHPSNAVAYEGEIGIYSQDNDKSLRTDQYASYHSNCYLFVVGNTQYFNSLIYPVYDAWYHMAYVLENGVFKVYQNGHLVGSSSSNLTGGFDLYSTNSHFYLGQSAYETDHLDYHGGFDDFRVYDNALSADDIILEYDLKYTDFLYNEYTFDSKEDLYLDKVRGYNIKSKDADTTAAATKNEPEYVDDSMYLSNSTAILAKASSSFGEPVNPKYLYGMSEITISMDVKMDDLCSCYFERIYDIFDASGQCLSFMTHTGGDGTSLNIVYQNNEHNNLIWVLDGSNGVFLLKNKWYNLTITIADNAFALYVNGELITKITNVESLMKKTGNFESSNNSWFTLNAPVYESNRYNSAYYDNLKIYGWALNSDELSEILVDSRLYSTITFVKDEGNEEVRHLDDETYLLPKIEKDGFSFIGYKDENDNLYVNELPKNLGDITLTPQFEQLQGTITFDDETVDSGIMDSYDITASNPSLPLNTFVKHGYNFVGWSTSKDGNVVYQDGANMSSVNENLTLYPVFEAKQYTVSFDNNNGVGNIDSLSCIYGNTYQLPENTFTRDGYTFKGWSSTPYGLVEYIDKYEFSGLKEGNDITLYAKWVLNEVTVSFDLNGLGSIDSFTKDAFTLIKLPNNPYEVEGKVFAGWALSKDGAVIYSNEEYVELIKDMKLYAIYDVKTFTVKFDDQVYTYNYGDELNIIEGPNKDGYTFVGWYDNKGNKLENTFKVYSDLEYVASYSKNEVPEDPTPSKKKGCKGSIGSLSILSLVGLIVLTLKRKSEVK